MDDLLGTGNRADGVILRCGHCSTLNRITSKIVDRAPVCGGCRTRLGQRRIIACDVSGSMNESAGSSRKIDVLREALSDITNSVSDCTILTFASYVKLIDKPNSLPSPSGGTALHLALLAARSLSPENVLVISDGHPDSAELAFKAAASLSGRIDVIYVGPDDDEGAKSFMLALARMHGGVVISRDLLRTEDASEVLAADAKMLLENKHKG